jgi:hypothetical protein
MKEGDAGHKVGEAPIKLFKLYLLSIIVIGIIFSIFVGQYADKYRNSFTG